MEKPSSFLKASVVFGFFSETQQCMLQILDHLLRQHSENKKFYPNFLFSSITLDGMWWAEYLKTSGKNLYSQHIGTNKLLLGYMFFIGCHFNWVRSMDLLQIFKYFFSLSLLIEVSLNAYCQCILSGVMNKLPGRMPCICLFRRKYDATRHYWVPQD